jgi:hypothetical protein
MCKKARVIDAYTPAAKLVDVRVLVSGQPTRNSARQPTRDRVLTATRASSLVVP